MNAAETARIPLADTPLEDFDRMFSANTRSSFLALRWAARRMRDGGRIVNISPLNTQLPTAGLALYMGSKAAAEQMTKAASRELGGRGITANTVSPGATDTEMLRGANPPEVLAAMPGMIALGRLGTAEDVAKVVAFLVGPDGAWMTGQNLLATGGMVI
ncbi:hypothetical protein DFJ74DRAFT_657872 [Hyaloraphidium curvatum]|nr:hypothetical protein DFJ74DRAFT_657872 [Hyaloraphidium curvatum]